MSIYQSRKNVERFLLFIVVCILNSQAAHAMVKEEGYLMARFIYTMVDHTAWETNDINICSYGHDEVSAELLDRSNIPEENRFNLHHIKNINFKDNIRLENASKCNIIYFAQYQEPFIPLVLERIENLPILTVSRIENFVDMGGIMGFKVVRQKLKLRINQTALDKSQIILSPIILRSIKPETP